MGLIYNLQKYVFSFIGDIKWSGIAHPFWFTINAKGYQIKGEHYRKLSKKLKPGDIVIRRFEGYIDKAVLQKTHAYTIENNSLSFVESLFSNAVLLIFLLLNQSSPHSLPFNHFPSPSRPNCFKALWALLEKHLS